MIWLVLTQNEINFLLDRITLPGTQEAGLTLGGGDSSLTMDKDFILRLGRASLVNQSEIDVAFTTTELWLMREVCKSFHRMGSETVGMNLRQKIFEALTKSDIDGIVEELNLKEAAQYEDKKYNSASTYQAGSQTNDGTTD